MDAGLYSIVMEFVENGNLEELLLHGLDDHPVVKPWECPIRMGWVWTLQQEWSSCTDHSQGLEEYQYTS